MGSDWMQQWLLQYQNFPIYLKFSNFRAMVYSLRVFIHTFHLIMIFFVTHEELIWSIFQEIHCALFCLDPSHFLWIFLLVSRPILLLWLACWSRGMILGCERSRVRLPDRPLLPMIAYKLLFLHWVKGVGKTIWKDYSKNVYLSNPFFKFVLNHIQLIQLLIATVKTYRNVLSCFLVRTYTNF